jgi:XTP/dITP diphosphohydrolase
MAIEPPRTDSFDGFVELVSILRKECPWDRDQTHESIAPNLIEEAYEVREAIQEGDDAQLAGELGDLLLHVVMHAVMAAERNAFTLADVIDRVGQKLIHRHPHVFGETSADSADAVKKNWEQLKMQEGRDSVLEGTPKAMPALQRAARIQEKASRVGFDWSDRSGPWSKVVEEIAEFENATEHSASHDELQEEFGDLLFSLVNVARFDKIKPEDALQASTDKFVRRFQHIERRINESGSSFADHDLESLDGLWNEAKAGES